METLSSRLTKLTHEVIQKISDLPPFDLRDKFKHEYEHEDDLIYDLPYSYTTDKNGYFLISLSVVGKDEDGNIICFETGEDWGNIYYKTLGELSVDTLVKLYDLATE